MPAEAEDPGLHGSTPVEALEADWYGPGSTRSVFRTIDRPVGRSTGTPPVTRQRNSGWSRSRCLLPIFPRHPAEFMIRFDVGRQPRSSY